jgi:hypothetical protein
MIEPLWSTLVVNQAYQDHLGTFCWRYATVTGGQALPP